MVCIALVSLLHFISAVGSACNVAKHKLIIEKSVYISLYPACNLICELSVSCIFSYTTFVF